MEEEASLTEELRRTAIEFGVDLFGAADLAQAHSFIEGHAGPYIAAFPRAVSLASSLSPAIVEHLLEEPDEAAHRTYRFYIYQVLNPIVDRASAALTRRLVQAGYRAYLVPASDKVGGDKLLSVFPHKLAANLAGLGFIGKSCLLVTEKYGARVRLGTVLTDAPLVTGRPLDRSCGECNRCVEICPPKAFTGVKFRPEDPREVRYKANLCDRFLAHRESKVGARVCGLCVVACSEANRGLWRAEARW